ncbi:hypothetical protein [Paraburkholderia saeva]|uniref:Uncharacterized protein n=1 Tax=Paraburkholderia saeva TaxID=2777537 RepID=A0A9N8X040_9BURK|nr:hypothetical protein [Paraburkholderia saeva]CAG4888492.1 hypothetical protein LMG31841_00682 [Paraburkholderia saeva]CAG4900420.1 hypothetical protein R70241_02748 [Paraburkholderia saeva]CAG4908181.1 hypothetical protein R52603_03601 [Paraburkholderia saeva]
MPDRHAALPTQYFAPASNLDHMPDPALIAHRPEPVEPPSTPEPDTIPDPTREPTIPDTPPIGDPPPAPNQTPHVNVD